MKIHFCSLVVRRKLVPSTKNMVDTTQFSSKLYGLYLAKRQNSFVKNTQFMNGLNRSQSHEKTWPRQWSGGLYAKLELKSRSRQRIVCSLQCQIKNRISFFGIYHHLRILHDVDNNHGRRQIRGS